MVLTITLVNGNGAQPTPAASTSDGQEIQWSSANDLVQLMSGQTFTGLLNPDGTITIPHLATAQHQQSHHQQHQLDPNNPNVNSNMQQQHNVAMSSPGPLATTTISSSAPFQYCRNVKLELNGQPSNSLSNIQAISSSDLSNINIINNNNNNDLNNSAFISNISHSQQLQQQQPQSATPVKKTIQKRLTAKQKQALQQQQQQQLQLQNQQQQIQQQQQMESIQSPDMRQPQQIINSNPDQSNIRSQQPQVVATVQLPNGQIGQLIAPSGGFWSPNALDLQQLSMAVAAATGTMPQPLSLPISAGQSAISIGNTSQQHIQITSNQHTQMQQSGSQHINSQGLAGSVPQSPSLSTGGGQVANAMIQRGAQQQFQSSNLQIAQQQQHPSLQIQMHQEQSGSQQTNQSLATTSPGVDSSPTPLSSQPSKKLKRLACTCPNCRDGENNRSSGDKKKQHICHFPDCNKVYGKTSHLRAHLRWHSGERPYICGWSFCGKKFTRSDELQRHRRTHTGEKRFQCQECNKRFMRSDHLSKHLKTHLSSKKCGNTSQQSPLLDSTQTF